MIKILTASMLPMVQQHVKKVRVLSFDIEIEYKNGKKESLGREDLGKLLDEFKIPETLVDIEFEE
jgi:hypothetical protein